MSDPVADFLAREQNVLAGIQDETLDVIAPAQRLLNNGILDSESDSITETAPISGTEESGLDLSALDGSVTGDGSQRTSPHSSVLDAKPEPEKIKKWREEQKLMLEKKALAMTANRTDFVTLFLLSTMVCEKHVRKNWVVVATAL
ncbi:unnamed protein product [Gongylonema pulchrum]|uniref:Clathrin light chain n=1 Tax=Gongylonema pulchrum TaxID=637853 RepID=A0A183EKI7_9BILA|nr:unnamed protein product [Gongylonema pulchrum]